MSNVEQQLTVLICFKWVLCYLVTKKGTQEMNLFSFSFPFCFVLLFFGAVQPNNICRIVRSSVMLI